MPVSTIAELSNCSKAYISQVRNGKRPPSKKLLDALESYHSHTRKGRQDASLEETIQQFLQSRRDGVALGTIDFYRKYLTKALPVLGLIPKPNAVQNYITSLTCSVGGKHAYFRAISIFYNWLYSPRSGFDYSDKVNPIALVEPPKRPKFILPSLSREQVEVLIKQAHCNRDKAIIALFTESGLRLSELLNIKPPDISWESRTIRVLGKGNKEGYAPFGLMAEQYLKCWLTEYNPQPNQHIWDIGFWGIKAMLDQLGVEAGLHCNPHTFRRTFACLLRKAGVDTMTIKDLGRWESLEMVQRYTRSVNFQDSLKFYKAPLS
ncbi:MAG: tyrosine-type recombinase/integrase [Dehalococcoidia bacterium]|nr:tyrosine-type recombinase/integrase [Dehalococcoidia bacterium]